MPTVKAGPISADRLKSFVERIEKLSEERDAIGSDIREVYAEAKGVGYDVKTMRKVVAERKIDPADRDEQEALLDVYRHALGSNSYRAVAEQFGISKSKLHRLVPKNETGTGEIETASSGSAGEGRETAVEGSPAPALASIQESCGGVESRHAAGNPSEPLATALNGEASHPNTSGPVRDSAAGVAPGPQDPIEYVQEMHVLPDTPPDIDIPAFLDRRASA